MTEHSSTPEAVARSQEAPGLHWTTTLHCGHCGSVIRYVDEVPAWRESAARRAEWEAARAWAEAHIGVRVPQIHWGGDEMRDLVSAAERYREYLLIEFSSSPMGPGTIVGYDLSPELRCVECPACSAEVLLADATAPDEE